MRAEAKQFQREPDSGKSAHDAETSVSQCDPDLPASEQEDALIAKRRKSGEPAEKAGKQEISEFQMKTGRGVPPKRPAH